MKFLKNISNKTYIIKLHIKPSSKSQKIINNNEFLTISLLSKPIQNRANKELINLLRRKLQLSSSQIQLISGSKSSKKIVKITLLETIEEKDLIRRLLNDL
ncbi:MAG: DUF167 domain-containing protein [Promethearchaeota archaeon]